MSEKRILISGGGIGGPALAFLLHRAGWQVTVIERASEFRASGQQIDITGAALTVVRRMGLDEPIREKIVHVKGLHFVDGKDARWASFAQEQTGDAFVKEYEILRSDLAGVFFDATKHDVEWIFGDFITGVKEDGSHVSVSFEKSKKRDFDAVVAAEGIRSKTRDLVFPSSNVEIRGFDQAGAFFTVPWEPSDGEWDRWYSAPEGRSMVLRPQFSRKTTGGYTFKIDKAFSSTLYKHSPTEQRKILHDLFSDCDWVEAPRLLKGIDEAEDFYTAEIAQVYCKHVAKGRVALLGDAGYCPSPITGQGTSIALIGAYVLAGCLTQNADVTQALAQYERDVRPFVTSAQRLPPGAPQIANPQTRIGVVGLYWLLWAVSVIISSGFAKVLTTVSAGFRRLLQPEVMKLPRYEALERSLPEEGRRYLQD